MCDGICFAFGIKIRFNLRFSNAVYYAHVMELIKNLKKSFGRESSLWLQCIYSSSGADQESLTNWISLNNWFLVVILSSIYWLCSVKRLKRV